MTLYVYRYRTIRSADKKFGVRQSDGSWNGIIGQMVTHQVRISLGGV